jgi:dTMP kinase
MTPVAETLLILAARSQHVAHVIEPALRSGAIVLCDRFSDSTFAYQGFARGLPLDWLRSVNEVATQGRSPDLTLLLDLPVRLGLSRRQRARVNLNRLDRESERFHRHVRRGYLTLAAQTSRRTIIVDAARPEEKIRAEIETLVLGWLRSRRT